MAANLFLRLKDISKKVACTPISNGQRQPTKHMNKQQVKYFVKLFLVGNE
jgi:hypothetical protein